MNRIIRKNTDGDEAPEIKQGGERDNDGEVKRQPPSKKVFNGDSGIRRQNVSFAEAVKGSRISRKDSVEGNVTESNMVRHCSLKSVAIHESETLEKMEYLKEKLIGEFEESDGDSRIEESLFDSLSKTTHAGTVNIELSDEVPVVKPDSVQMVNAGDDAVDTPNSPKKAVNNAGGNSNHSTSREGEKTDSKNVGNMGNAIAGDQGHMLGSATVETSELTPLRHVRTTKLEAELTDVTSA
ncbi:hypothetical protein L2E82_16859 [Cichorium intybus]|uniref:Uncharacterized protein n=1 Tax=Cichorium intybus TaxID=13427 RepID=A0ACB9F6P3_CICIN|nr:hypothetical protein L2E82_16859 [Cichorium intybus]